VGEICEKKGARRVTIFTDSQETLRRIQSDEPGPGQVVALRMMRWESELLKKNIQVEYLWVPAYKGIEGNVQADQQGITAAYKHRGQYTETQNLLPFLDYVSFTHISRRMTETKWEESRFSNGSGPSLRVWVWVQTERLPNCRSGSSINPNCSLRYGSMVNSQPV
jgi:hypothetical protein